MKWRECEIYAEKPKKKRGVIKRIGFNLTDWEPENGERIKFIEATPVLAHIADLQKKLHTAVNALETCKKVLELNRDDFDKLRTQSFVEFNVHELDTASIIARQALEKLK